MSDSFGTYWTNFAKHLNPNGNGTDPTQPNWPTYDADSQRHMTLDVPPVESTNLYNKQCELWDQIAQWTKGQKIASKLLF